jgi:hypothetical protein
MPDGMNFCAQCGSALAGGAFCGECGARLQQPAHAQQATAPSHQPSPPTTNPASADSARRTANAMGAITGVGSAGSNPAARAWWAVVGCGALVLFSAFLPWWSTRSSVLGFFAKSSSSTTIGWGAGGTALIAMACAAAAAILGSAQVHPAVRLRRTPSRPALAIVLLAATALVCVLVRALTIGGGGGLLTPGHSSPRAGIFVAILAAAAQLACAVWAARLVGASLRPNLGIALDSAPTRSGAVPGDVRTSAVISFVQGGLTALLAFIVLVISSSLSSVSFLAPLGRIGAVLSLIPAAIAAWLLVLGVQLLAGRRWARIGAMVTQGLFAALLAIGTLSSNDDPTTGLIFLAIPATAVITLCTTRARSYSWS